MNQTKKICVCKKLSPAFTLAEVLITLAVIGVVAVLAIGIFMPKIQDKVLAAQAKTAKIKFTKAMEQMALNNKIGPLYQDTEEFVSELQNYLKLAKVCDNDKLSDCFGYETLTDAEGKEFALADAANGSVFNMPNDNTNDFAGDTRGLVTIDGTPMILAWNKKCEILEPGIYEWGNNTNKSTSCVAALMDVNGTKRPDRIGKDLVLLNASQFGNSACIEFTVEGTTYKWGCPFETTPLSYAECMELEDAENICPAEGIQCVISGTHSTFDFWASGDYLASAIKICGGTDKMPTPQDLMAFASYLYGMPLEAVNYSSLGGQGINAPVDETKLLALNNTTLIDAMQNNGAFLLWSNVVASYGYAYGFAIMYGANTVKYQISFNPPAIESIYRSTPGGFGVCKL